MDLHVRCGVVVKGNYQEASDPGCIVSSLKGSIIYALDPLAFIRDAAVHTAAEGGSSELCAVKSVAEHECSLGLRVCIKSVGCHHDLLYCCSVSAEEPRHTPWPADSSARRHELHPQPSVSNA